MSKGAIKHFNKNRCFGTTASAKSFDLHCFHDASERAYRITVYLRCQLDFSIPYQNGFATVQSTTSCIDKFYNCPSLAKTQSSEMGLLPSGCLKYINEFTHPRGTMRMWFCCCFYNLVSNFYYLNHLKVGIKQTTNLKQQPQLID